MNSLKQYLRKKYDGFYCDCEACDNHLDETIRGVGKFLRVAIDAKREEIKSLSTKHGFNDSDVIDLVCDSIIKLVGESCNTQQK